MGGVIPTFGFRRSAAFGLAASRYWLGVFPSVSREVRRRRELALAIPDPVLRRLALQALECKHGNLEGAAAFELLAGRFSSRALVRALSACQTMCDYLDLLSEQPARDPVLNGYRLHEALLAALSPDSGECAGNGECAGDGECAGNGECYDYYAHHACSEDGGYLQALVDDVRETLDRLPSSALVRAPLRRTAERIVSYQSFNHGDRHGSHEPFRRWAAAQTVPGSGMSWWETGAAVGSTLLMFALMACAARPRLTAEDVARVESAYHPWIGALHTLLDSLVDLEEDDLTGGHQLIGCYRSPVHAAQRMRRIAREARSRAEALPDGRRHGLLVVAMTGFYLCEARPPVTEHAGRVGPALLREVGGLATPAMLMVGARRAARRTVSQPALVAAAK